MTDHLLESVTIEPAQSAQYTVIWLHGLGADGHDFEGIVPELQLQDHAVRFIFPHAPMRPVTVNGGMTMRAWYDIVSPNLLQFEDQDGIHQSAEAIAALIAAEKAQGIPANRIALAGFSQGGAIALHLACRYPQQLAGVAALSTYLPLQQALRAERQADHCALPIFYAHGTFDPIVPIALGEMSRQTLEEVGYQVAWHSYPLMHQVDPKEIKDLALWFRSIFQ